MAILAIHGDMAVGKTTLLKGIQESNKNWHVDLEDIQSPLEKIRGLNQENFKDFQEIQRHFLNHEKKRFTRLKKHTNVLMDYSIEEVLFHTHQRCENNKSSWGNKDPYLSQVKEDAELFFVDRILYLHASKSVLKKRKENDGSRTRKSFEVYLESFYPYKLKWFKNYDHIDVLNTDTLSQEAVLAYVLKWLSAFEVNHNKKV